MRKCYIASYRGETETILKRDTCWTEAMRQFWDKLMSERKADDPPIQAWYSDDNQVELLAQCGVWDFLD